LVLQQFPEAVLLLAGPGDPDQERLSAIPGRNVRDLGAPDEFEKADALAACDLFCLPSAHESFGLVYIEAWLYGKPVICGSAPACRELVADGVTGLWGTQHPGDLARTIVRLLSDERQRSEIGLNGRQRTREYFIWDRCIEQHLQVFSNHS
jgi:glycosyltransferase involved in cell wall biosynthesis